LPITGAAAANIARVHYYAKYDGFDENGDGSTTDWHGMTKRKEPIGHIGSSETAPYAVRWDTSMIQSQAGVQVRAVIELQSSPEIVASEMKLKKEGNRYWKSEGFFLQTAASAGFAIKHAVGMEVAYVPARNQSVPFWSRAMKKKHCEFALPIPLAQIERAQLHIAIWDGGAGTIQDYFRFNGHPMPIAKEANHDVLYSQLPIEPKWLVPGVNRADLLSDTEHHGIEVFHPGPMIAVRYRVE
jgi:hypothetical protein